MAPSAHGEQFDTMPLRARHSLPTRVFHWINVPVLAVMIWSGILIYWAYGVYRIEILGVTLVQFFPPWFYENPLWTLHHRLAEGMAWHFTFAWLFAINGLLYVAHSLWRGEWREMLPGWRSFPEAFQVVLHDLGIRKEPLPPGKYNAAQRIAYTGVILMGAGSLATGLALYKPTQLWWLAAALGGYQAARLEHFVLTLGLVLFIVIHLAQVLRAGWSNFRAMVIGVELAAEEPQTAQALPANSTSATFVPPETPHV